LATGISNIITVCHSPRNSIFFNVKTPVSVTHALPPGFLRWKAVLHCLTIGFAKLATHGVKSHPTFVSGMFQDVSIDDCPAIRLSF
jgi:hypothetical protein